MNVPDVRYAISDDDVRIAYMEFGDGPPTLYLGGPFTHLEAFWLSGLQVRLYQRMSANLRLFVFDHRGTGMSDGFIEPPSVSDRCLDIRAITKKAGVPKINLVGFDFGGQLAVAYAAMYPDAVDRLVTVNTWAGRSSKERARELNPHTPGGVKSASKSSRLDQARTIGVDDDKTTWEDMSPSLARYPDEIRLRPQWERLVGSRDSWRRQIESVASVDIGDLAPDVEAPTLVTHVSGDRMHHVGYARQLAELIPNSRLQEISGEDHAYWVGDSWREFADAHIEFITGHAARAPATRQFAVVVFTDIVGSTQSSTSAGDDEWLRLLETHDRMTRRIVSSLDGSVVKQTGDGVLATFTTPSNAVDAVVELRRDLATAGIPIRAGIHAGEVEDRGGDISGATVNLAARVEQTAEDGEIYVTKTVRDMLIGSSRSFQEAGSYQLKGFDGNWILYRVAE